MNNRQRNVNNNSNWNNTNQYNKSTSNNIAIGDCENQTIHKLNPYTNNHNIQELAQNVKSNQSEFLNEVEMVDFVVENSNNEAEKPKENFKEYKLSIEEIDSIIKRGQTKITLNNLANKMMEDLRGKFNNNFNLIINNSR